MASYNATSAPEVLLEQTRRVLLAFHLYGDSSPHFALPRPAVSPLVAMLLVLGMGFCLARPGDLRRMVLLLWIGLTLLLGGVLTNDPPYWPHLNITLPAVMLIAGVAADRLLGLIEHSMSQRVIQAVKILLIGLIVFTGITNWHTYVTYAENNAGPRLRMSRFIASLPPIYAVHLVSERIPANTYAFQFFNADVSIRNTTPDDIRLSPPLASQPLLFILHEQPDLADTLREIYPGGIFQAHLNRYQEVAFLSYQVIPGVTADSTLRTYADPPFDTSGLPFLAGVMIFVAAQAALFIVSGNVNEATLARIRRMFSHEQTSPDVPASREASDGN